MNALTITWRVDFTEYFRATQETTLPFLHIKTVDKNNVSLKSE